MGIAENIKYFKYLHVINENKFGFLKQAESNKKFWTIEYMWWKWFIK